MRKVWKTCGRRPGRTDGESDGRSRTETRTDGHHHTIIRPVWRRAYNSDGRIKTDPMRKSAFIWDILCEIRSLFFPLMNRQSIGDITISVSSRCRASGGITFPTSGAHLTNHHGNKLIIHCKARPLQVYINLSNYAIYVCISVYIFVDCVNKVWCIIVCQGSQNPLHICRCPVKGSSVPNMVLM